MFIGKNYSPERPLHDILKSHKRPFSVECWHLKFFTPQLLLHIVKISHRPAHNTHAKLLKIANMLCGDIHHPPICLRQYRSTTQVWFYMFWSFTFTFAKSFFKKIKSISYSLSLPESFRVHGEMHAPVYINPWPFATYLFWLKWISQTLMWLCGWIIIQRSSSN